MENWILREQGFNPRKIFDNGNKFMTGNGYMGYRGTLEEYRKEHLTACILSGLYDKVGDKWREPVNAPNTMYLKIFCDGNEISLLTREPARHNQILNIRNGVHRRETLYMLPDGNMIEVSSERFASMDDIHLMCMKYEFSVSRDCLVTIETGIDGDVWDINGPHLENYQYSNISDTLVLHATTHELKIPVVTAELCHHNLGAEEIVQDGKSYLRRIQCKAQAGKKYILYKYSSIVTGNDDFSDFIGETVKRCHQAKAAGYETLLGRSSEVWENYWAVSDVEIEGDPEGQFALRYSIYQLLIIAPAHSDKLSIPARGLSGQVYKGAIFWDTEIFMLPFFIYTNPSIARNLLMYRCHTLDGARRKAKEYGYQGAFYAWESQETGDDACTHFNITDIFTGRPMRTYFRDKQIHISADIAYAIWQYVTLTGDESLLLDGGAEVILECARFFYSYAYFKPQKNRFELLDVTGPDEYHERFNNNAYTNKMVKHTLRIALDVLDLLKAKYREKYDDLVTRLEFEEDMTNIAEMYSKLYVPEPDRNTKVIEQFDGYHSLEDVSLDELKSRIINKNEYLGGGNGLATNTQILKQADVILMLHLFKNQYDIDTLKVNWDYYEPRTEHGSSLSPCVYALVASEVGYTDYAYKYFLKTSTIDLTGEAKQFVGDLYIGGTHPAANGGSWMSAILGFCGIRGDEDCLYINPRLPEKWNSVKFRIIYKNQRLEIYISKSEVRLTLEKGPDQAVSIKGRKLTAKAGQTIAAAYSA